MCRLPRRTIGAFARGWCENQRAPQRAEPWQALRIDTSSMDSVGPDGGVASAPVLVAYGEKGSGRSRGCGVP